MDPQLKRLITLWEKGCPLVLEIHAIESHGNVTHVVRTDPGSYRVMRYFPIGGTWHASCDLSDGTADDAFAALHRLYKGA